MESDLMEPSFWAAVAPLIIHLLVLFGVIPVEHEARDLELLGTLGAFGAAIIFHRFSRSGVEAKQVESAAAASAAVKPQLQDLAAQLGPLVAPMLKKLVAAELQPHTSALASTADLVAAATATLGKFMQRPREPAEVAPAAAPDTKS